MPRTSPGGPAHGDRIRPPCHAHVRTIVLCSMHLCIYAQHYIQWYESLPLPPLSLSHTLSLPPSLPLSRITINPLCSLLLLLLQLERRLGLTAVCQMNAIITLVCMVLLPMAHSIPSDTLLVQRGILGSTVPFLSHSLSPCTHKGTF